MKVKRSFRENGNGGKGEWEIEAKLDERSEKIPRCGSRFRESEKRRIGKRRRG